MGILQFSSSWLVLIVLLPITASIVQAQGESSEHANQFDIGLDGDVIDRNQGISNFDVDSYLKEYAGQKNTGHDTIVDKLEGSRELQSKQDIDGEASLLQEDKEDKLDSEDDFPHCDDLHEKCELWESIGECDAVDGNPEFMYRNCLKSCKLCGNDDIDSLLEKSRQLRHDDLAIAGWGVEQDVDVNNKEAIHILLDDIKRYMFEEVNVEEKYQSFKKKCQNRHEKCAFWAFEGEVRLTMLHVSIYPLWIVCIRLTQIHFSYHHISARRILTTC